MTHPGCNGPGESPIDKDGAESSLLGKCKENSLLHPCQRMETWEQMQR